MPTKWRIWIGIALLCAMVGAGIYVAFVPSQQWQKKAYLDLDMTVVDYTVPFDDYKEHRGLFWLLNHLKVMPPRQRNSDRPKGPWQQPKHYIGYKPHDTKQTARLFKRGKRRPALLYLADTYGVYRDDIRNRKTRQAHMDYNPLRFGGLKFRDVMRVEQWVKQGTHLIVEFNSICDPTETTARRQIERMIGLGWTEWVGRTFEDPKDTNEVPYWLPRLFRKRYPNRPYPSKPTLFLVSRSEQLLYISGRRVRDIVPRLHMTNAGKQRFPSPSSNLSYVYWFSLMKKRPSKRALQQRAKPLQVYANFHLPEDKAFRQQLKRYGLSPILPAFTEYTCTDRSRCFYFAGDFSDIDFDPGQYQRSDVLSWQRRFTPSVAYSAAPLYWHFFAPVMTQLIPSLRPTK